MLWCGAAAGDERDTGCCAPLRRDAADAEGEQVPRERRADTRGGAGAAMAMAMRMAMAPLRVW